MRGGSRVERVRVLQRLRDVGASYWLVPSLMAVGAVGLSFGMIYVDRRFLDGELVNWAYGGDAAGAREVLGTIAGSMITVAGVVFSITIVALSLASRQFGPLLLRSFLADRPNQAVLGTFVATFLYCLLVLRAVRGASDAFVPELSITVAIALGVASLGVFIFFIHHTAQSIRADALLARLGRDLEHRLRRLEKEHAEGPPEAAPPADFERRGAVLPATGDGYVRRVAEAELLHVAREHDLVVKPLVRNNDFAVCGAPLVRVYPSERCTAEVAGALCAAFVLGSERDPTEDVRGGLEQLVQLCLRALSPSLNDPTTAKAAIDRMTATLAAVARIANHAPHRFDEDGRLRVVATRTSLAELIDQTLESVRRNAERQADVTRYLLDSVGRLVPSLRTEPDRVAVRQLLRRIEATMASDALDSDRPMLQQAARRVWAELERGRA